MIAAGRAVERFERSAWERLRLPIVVVLFVGLYAVGRATGLVELVDAQTIREAVEGAGALGILLFVAIFTIGELLHVPGMVFVAGGILAWGRFDGFVVALAASIVSVCVSFLVVRAAGGEALSRIDRPLMRRLLGHLHARPIRTIVLLRAVFWLAPPLNYALALSSVRFRDYAIGSAVGLVVPVLLAAFFFDLLLT
jgi:uncharacterized membrane protein YdjX (TVP38/TMEM64 family)